MGSLAGLIIATRNPHKTREVEQIVGSEFVVHDLSAYPDLPETAETGVTFDENAILKAVSTSHHVGRLVLADDSGLEVDALSGAPGVFSARYAGERSTDYENVQKLLGELEEVDPEKKCRNACFRCVLAIAQNGKVLGTFSGQIDGNIIAAPRGSGGFGYDPVFVPNGFEQTFAELPAETKNRISHRARALQAAIPFLRAAIGAS